MVKLFKGVPKDYKGRYIDIFKKYKIKQYFHPRRFKWRISAAVYEWAVFEALF